ncbi:unannotated protein [freshwater metagenome]|uniref:Unannotated protein n=1 Tax=freshwater metagenome TaxID=449393 RepID=A0A6J5YIG9_9ZZZZ
MDALHIDHVHRPDVVTSSGCSFDERKSVAMTFGVTGEQGERIDIDEATSRGIAHRQDQFLIGGIECG